MKKKRDDLPSVQPSSDALAHALCYRLRRDSLMIVSNMKRGTPQPTAEASARLLVWVQGKLLEAMMHDPAVPSAHKDHLADFHAKTVRDALEDRRGAKRRRRLALQQALTREAVAR